MSEAAQPINWERHSPNSKNCAHCGTGYPRPCACGGQAHREVMTLPGGGYVQLTRCDSCHTPDGQ